MSDSRQKSGTFDLARLVYDDAQTSIREAPNFADMLDLTLASLEFERATGSDFGTKETFFEAVDVLRHYRDLPPWLFGGAAHAGWTAVQVARHTAMPLRGLEGLDDMILSWIVDFPEKECIDLVGGLLGLGLYGLVHPDNDVAEKMTREALRVIEQRVEHDDDGIFVRIAATDFRQIMKPESVGQRDLGVAHGNPGLVGYLSRVVTSGLSSGPEAERLLRPALRWLLRQRSDLGDTLYPHTVEGRYEPSRSAWCYGDPGISLVLRAAGEALGDAEAASVAREAAVGVLARPSNRTRAVDSGLCHGAATLCWFGHRAAEEWRLPGTADLSAYWVNYIREDRASGPLHYVRPDGLVRNPSFLDGDLGVALTLLRDATGRQPTWEDRLLGGPLSATRR